MEPFTSHSGIVAPLGRDNVDTDQIIPKQFLKRVERTGFGQFLFYDWRFLADGSPNPDFVLNRPEYAGATILVAGRNFGSGSSREHAPWALQDYGFRVIIASSFADIFRNNCIKNGLVPVVLPEEAVAHILQAAQNSAGYRVHVDLVSQSVKDDSGNSWSFEMETHNRLMLLNGVDEIADTLQFEEDIREYERRRSPWLPVTHG